jgi:RNase P protein component
MRFIMSVPKRVLRLAVWRNQARRVAREAWAAACRQSPHLLRQSYSIMLRLTQKPADRVDTLNVQSNATVIGAAKIKAVLRQDCDALLVQLLQRLSV